MQPLTAHAKTQTLAPPAQRALEAWRALGWSESLVASDLGDTEHLAPGEGPEPALLPTLGLDAEERYSFRAELGRGGMGSVTLARDNLLGRTVAIKRLIAARPDAETVQRFWLEAQVTGQLSHPNIVDLHEVGVDAAGLPYFTMQHVKGGQTLEEVIERLRAGDPEAHARYTMERRVQIVQQIARALDYAHTQGVVHRDVKPANIMVGRFDEVLLMDWGLARIPDGEARIARTSGIDLVHPPAQTDPERLLGTPLYMAPEQLREHAEARSDVYALAAVLQELLSLNHYLGDPSFDLKVLARQILEQAPARPDEDYDPLNGRVPRALADVCARGLAKDPEERFQSAGDLADQLQAWLEGRGTARCPNSALLRAAAAYRRALHNHPGPATLGTLAVLGGVAGSVAFTLSQLLST
jgi:serine/threonine-protein kinase